MRNEYDLAYTRVSGDADGFYVDYSRNSISHLDYIRLFEIFNGAGMDDEADEVRKEILERFGVYEEVEED